MLNQQLTDEGKNKANHKRIYRIMKQHGLMLPAYGRKRTKAHVGKIITLRSNTKWCSYTFIIQCFNGDRVFVAFALDTCDREAMKYVSSTLVIDGSSIRNLIMDSVEYRFGKIAKLAHPKQWLSNNGSCYVSRETMAFARGLGFEVVHHQLTVPKAMEWLKRLSKHSNETM